MTGGDPAVFHFVDPIARFGDRGIMRCEEQGFAALVN